MDVLYRVRRGDNEELRYSLRSLANVDHGRVVVAGHCPEWVRNVTHIPHWIRGSKWYKAQENLRAALPHLSDQFILIDDDMYVMESGPIPTLHKGPLRPSSNSSLYSQSRRMAVNWLARHGCSSPLNYELHVPMIFDRDRLASVLAAKVMPGHIRSLYGNVFQIGGERMAIDVKMIGDVKPGRFASTTDTSWKETPGDYIRAAFPDPSPYE